MIDLNSLIGKRKSISKIDFKTLSIAPEGNFMANQVDNKSKLEHSPEEIKKTLEESKIYLNKRDGDEQ